MPCADPKGSGSGASPPIDGRSRRRAAAAPARLTDPRSVRSGAKKKVVSTWTFGDGLQMGRSPYRIFGFPDWRRAQKRGVLEVSEPVPAKRFRIAVFGIRRPTRSREATLRGAFAACRTRPRCTAPTDSSWCVGGGGWAVSRARIHVAMGQRRASVSDSRARRRLALDNARSMAKSSRAVSSSSAWSAASAWAVTRRDSSSRAVAMEDSSAELAGMHRSWHPAVSHDDDARIRKGRGPGRTRPPFR